MSPRLHIPCLVGWLAAFLAGPAATYGVARWLGRAPHVGTTAVAPAPASGTMADASAAAVGRPKPLESAFLEQIRAERRLETMPPSDARALVLAGRAFPDRLPELVKQWAAGDARGAFEWVMKQFPVPENLPGETALAFFRVDPEAAMKAVMALDREGLSAREAIRTAFFSGDPATAAKIAPYVDELFAPVPRTDVDDFHNEWGVSFPFDVPKGDQRAFGKQIESLPPSRGRKSLLEALGRSWFSLENRDAWDWAKTLPPDDRGVVESALISEVVLQNFSDKPPGSGSEVLAWARDWLAQPDHGAERAKHGVSVTEAIAMGNFREGWNWAMETLDAAPLTDAIHLIVSGVKDADRATAVELVQDLPPGGVRSSAIDALARSVQAEAGKNPTAAQAWADSLPAGPLKTGVLKALEEKARRGPSSGDETNPFAQ